MTTDAQAVGLPFEEAIDFFMQKGNVTTKRWTDVWKEAHSRSFMVAGAATDALVQDFRDAVDKAIAKGTTLAEFRRDFDAIVKKHGWVYHGKPGWRSRVIYETNLAGAYSAGRYAQMTDPDVRSAYPYWQYVHSGSKHPRLQHLAWDGLTLRCDDAFWDTHYPPNGWHCGCRVRPITKGGLGRLGKDGPDKAPPIEYRTWLDKKTGASHQVPVGIDPGFDYNPGKAWKEAPVRSNGFTPAIGLQRDPDLTPIQTHDLAKADEELRAAQAPWADGLTPDQAIALEEYKTAGGRAMNLQLRGQITDAGVARRASELRTALDAASAPTDMIVWRGIGPEEASVYQSHAAGETLRAAAFVSTSLDRKQASAVAKAQGGALVEVVIRRGTSGVAYIHPFPRYRYKQYEVLVNAGLTLKVLRADAEEIRLEVLDDDATE